MKASTFRVGKMKKAAIPIVRGLEATREARSALAAEPRLVANLRPGETPDADWGIFEPYREERI